MLFRLHIVRLAALTVILFGFGSLAQAQAPSKLDEIKDRGFVICGVSRSGTGLSEIKVDGTWDGFFIDFCKVLGAAVFSDSQAVEYVEVTDLNRFEALQEDAIDVLMANTTWTVARDSQLGLSFVTTLFYDGQGFLGYRQLGASTLAEASSARVCVNRNTTTILNLQDLIASSKPDFEIIAFDAIETLYSAFLSQRCDILTYDRVVLQALQRYRASNPDELVLYPEVISKEPLGPAVKQGAPAWFDVVQWSMFATMAAEELGITSDNVDTAGTAKASGEVRRLLGLEGEIGAGLGLDRSWAASIIAQVGNYAEIYNRHLGSPDGGTDRGMNALWRDGGLHYAPPIR